jgi:hypothetical protein
MPWASAFNQWLGLPPTVQWSFTLWIGALWFTFGYLVMRWCDERVARASAKLRAKDWTDPQWWP